MARKIPGWLKFTGLGCFVIILLGVALIVGSTFFVRDALRQFETADRSMEDVEERYGSIQGFRPRADGVIPAERIDVFLAVRDTTEAARGEMEQSLATLSGDRDEVVFASVRKVTAGVTLLRNTARFLAGRNQALMDADMGLGEYYYIYTLAYYQWLGRSPADGPSFELVGDNGYVMEEAVFDLEETEVREQRLSLAVESLNRLLLPVLRNQLAELDDDGVALDQQEWRGALVAEIAAMESDRRRLPWADGLPETIAASFLPRRDRFEASYGAMSNALEIGVARR